MNKIQKKIRNAKRIRSAYRIQKKIKHNQDKIVMAVSALHRILIK